MKRTIAVLTIALGLALPSSALAVNNSLGEDRAAISSYGSELANTFENRYGESLEWEIRYCYPHGPSWHRVLGLFCALDTPNGWWLVAATNWRNGAPRGMRLAGEYGPIDVWTSKIKHG
jgi:hypothetical protein